MEAKEKARELVERFRVTTQGLNGKGQLIDYIEDAKGCAKFVVDEILKEIEQLRKPEYTTFVISYKDQTTQDGYEKMEYWQEVKQEIEKQ